MDLSELSRRRLLAGGVGIATLSGCLGRSEDPAASSDGDDESDVQEGEPEVREPDQEAAVENPELNEFDEWVEVTDEFAFVIQGVDVLEAIDVETNDGTVTVDPDGELAIIDYEIKSITTEDDVMAVLMNPHAVVNGLLYGKVDMPEGVPMSALNDATVREGRDYGHGLTRFDSGEKRACWLAMDVPSGTNPGDVAVEIHSHHWTR